VRGVEFIKADTRYQYANFDDLHEYTAQRSRDCATLDQSSRESWQWRYSAAS